MNNHYDQGLKILTFEQTNVFLLNKVIVKWLGTCAKLANLFSAPKPKVDFDLHLWSRTKGQVISKGNFDVFILPKIWTKIFEGILP